MRRLKWVIYKLCFPNNMQDSSIRDESKALSTKICQNIILKQKIQICKCPRTGKWFNYIYMVELLDNHRIRLSSHFNDQGNAHCLMPSKRSIIQNYTFSIIYL